MIIGLLLFFTGLVIGAVFGFFLGVHAHRQYTDTINEIFTMKNDKDSLL